MADMMSIREAPILDLDHVVTGDGRVYRVVGNSGNQSHFLGYNVYSPSTDGDRSYRGRRYRKNFIEDEWLPADVLDTYELVEIKSVAEHHDPVQAARSKSSTFQSTVWFSLYVELVDLFGEESVGIFGSSMFGLHLTPEGQVRKDIDFMIQGMSNVDVLRQHLPRIRAKLGFTSITTERQLRQYARYRRVFRNKHNSIRSIIARRWTGLQLSDHVVTTIRMRDPGIVTPIELLTTPSRDPSNVIVSGTVTDADSSNLFPRKFTLATEHEQMDIFTFWWKFSTPVREGDEVTVCGNLIPTERGPVVRLTNFVQHWLKIDN